MEDWRKAFWNALEKDTIYICFHESQEGTVVIVMPLVSPHLSAWLKNVPVKSTRRHTWLLTELGLLGSFLLADFVPPSDFKCFEEFKEVLEFGKYCLIFFLGSWGLAHTASLCLCHLPPEERRLVILTEVSELLGVGWGSGLLLVKCRQLQR